MRCTKMNSEIFLKSVEKFLQQKSQAIYFSFGFFVYC